MQSRQATRWNPNCISPKTRARLHEKWINFVLDVRFSRRCYRHKTRDRLGLLHVGFGDVGV